MERILIINYTDGVRFGSGRAEPATPEIVAKRRLVVVMTGGK